MIMIPTGGTDANDASLYDLPRGSCPNCGGRQVRHLVIGLPAVPDAVPETPPWVEWVGCMHPGYDRLCEECGLTWSADG